MLNPSRAVRGGRAWAAFTDRFVRVGMRDSASFAAKLTRRAVKSGVPGWFRVSRMWNLDLRGRVISLRRCEEGKPQ
jgi:hypothetical protein